MSMKFQRMNKMKKGLKLIFINLVLCIFYRKEPK